MTRPFCAVCLEYIFGPVERQPWGKNSALVVVCAGCSQDEPEPELAESSTVEAAKERIRRDRRRELGLCKNSDHHGPATHGILCKKCRLAHRRSDALSRVKQRDVRRVRRQQRRAA